MYQPVPVHSNKSDLQPIVQVYPAHAGSTGKRTGMGSDKKEAVKAAIQLNQLLIKDVDLVSKVIRVDDPFSDYVEYYRDHVLPAKRNKGFELSKSFMKEAVRRCNVFIKELGHINFSAMTQQDIADYLKSCSSAEVYNSHKTLLTQIFKQAISDGRQIQNYPALILRADTEHTQRERLSFEDYKAIYACASPPIQHAMELSLNSLQRRTDIKNWRFDYDRGDGYIYLIQSKTRKHGRAAYLRIPADLPIVHAACGAKTLSELISSYKDELDCPYVIHQKLAKNGIKISEEKDHIMQLTGDKISKGFAEARKRAGVAIESDHPPSFHELLSLGEFLRKQQGWSLKEIQTLRGHTSEK
ncbi:MAG: hypothetical protein IBX57_08740 [Gammaproteobacteria bacterium]|nr:hypothetical protein [Gammaproteobacteria bacterium]